jgi:predicted RNA-binding Zn-ribbon protein involved in translation (DUF1610 family)
MEKGSLVEQGTHWNKLSELGKFATGIALGSAKRVFAYHCPTCGNISLSTQDK